MKKQIPIEKVRETANKIDGHLSDKEGEFLYNAAKNCLGKGVIVEIGSWKGKSTVYLAKGSEAGNNVKVYAIDPHQGSRDHQDNKISNTFGIFKQNLEKANVDNIVKPIVKTSQEASKGWQLPVELLWIDGNHSYEMVKLDFDLWSPHLVKGGIIAFHDAVSGGPKKVVCEFVLRSNKFSNAGLIDSLFFARKSVACSLKEKIKNRMMIFLLNMYEFFREIHLPKALRKSLKAILVKFV